MASDIFMDSSGLYALADEHDPLHVAAETRVHELLHAKSRFILTDYILDESVTLASARSGTRAALRLLDLVEGSSAFEMQWVGQIRFAAAKAFFRKHADHHYSFTDCTSFVVMRELGLGAALTSDRHFKEAGFHLLL
jgi:hypothetical protein